MTDDEFEELKKKAAATRAKRWGPLFRSDWRERLRVWEAQNRGIKDRETDGDKIAFETPGPKKSIVATMTANRILIIRLLDKRLILSPFS